MVGAGVTGTPLDDLLGILLLSMTTGHFPDCRGCLAWDGGGSRIEGAALSVSGTGAGLQGGAGSGVRSSKADRREPAVDITETERSSTSLSDAKLSSASESPVSVSASAGASPFRHSLNAIATSRTKLPPRQGSRI